MTLAHLLERYYSTVSLQGISHFPKLDTPTAQISPLFEPDLAVGSSSLLTLSAVNERSPRW